MATNHLRMEEEATLSDRGGERAGEWLDRDNQKIYQRRLNFEPQPYSWLIVAAGAIAPLGLAGAALATTYRTSHQRAAIAAWIAAAVVGSASVISAAVVSRRIVIAWDRDGRDRRIRSA